MFRCKLNRIHHGYNYNDSVQSSSLCGFSVLTYTIFHNQYGARYQAIEHLFSTNPRTCSRASCMSSARSKTYSNNQTKFSGYTSDLSRVKTMASHLEKCAVAKYGQKRPQRPITNMFLHSIPTTDGERRGKEKKGDGSLDNSGPFLARQTKSHQLPFSFILIMLPKQMYRSICMEYRYV